MDRIPKGSQVTIRLLFSHTSGIYEFADDSDSPSWSDAFLDPDADWTKVWTLQELLAYAEGARHVPYFAPSEGVACSNVDLLLGIIIEVAPENEFGAELQNRILDPLDRDDTRLVVGRRCLQLLWMAVSASRTSSSTPSSRISPGCGCWPHHLDHRRANSICTGSLQCDLL